MQVSVLSKTASRLTKSSQLSKNTRFRSYSSHPPVGDEDPISGEREIYNVRDLAFRFSLGTDPLTPNDMM